MANVTVNITSDVPSSNASSCYVTIYGTKYSSSITMTIQQGTTISVRAGGRSNTVTVYGEAISSGSTQPTTYEFTPTTGAVDINLHYQSGNSTVEVTVTEGVPVSFGANHGTLINGTAYEIESGKTLIGGTAYVIDNSKTLISGTAYEIVFSATVTVNFIGNGNSSSCYANIYGTNYYSATTVECDAGAAIAFYAWASSTMGKKNSYISLNGTQVATGTTSAAATYAFVPDETVSTVNVTFATGSSSSWNITVTTS